MHFRMKPATGYRAQMNVYKVQVRLFFIWVDCITGIDGHPYVPDFTNEKSALAFAEHYASIRNENVTSFRGIK